MGLAFAAFVALSAPPDVTSEAGRRLNLIEYAASRDDLSADERKRWDKAIRRAFGGKALKDGTDEGVTSAKSVIAAAIFFGVEPEKAARAAFEAYHDTYRWVPPPIAVSYQLLKMQGRAPKASPREIAYDFERHYDPEIAPELVAWWEEMLGKGAIEGSEADNVRRVLEATRDRLRPILLDRLFRGMELEARPRDAEVQRELARLAKELGRGFANVGRSPAVRSGSYESRYHALARELGVAPRKVTPREERPRVAPPPVEPQQVESTPAPQQEPPRGKNKGKGKGKAKGQQSEPPAGGVVTTLGEIGQRLQEVVAPWLGTPYLFGGVDRRGVDCSAFVRAVVAAAMGVELPRNSRAQYDVGREVAKEELSAGDLVFFDTMDRGTVSHVGIYVGGGQFVHASSTKGVTMADLAARYYQRAWWGARRL